MKTEGNLLTRKLCLTVYAYHFLTHIFPILTSYQANSPKLEERHHHGFLDLRKIAKTLTVF